MDSASPEQPRALSSLAATDSVENVVIFVSDALRYDSVPEQIRRRGITARAIAPSTFTANALPSITSGKYPATHKVWRFQDDRLASRPALFDEAAVDVGFNAETVWLMDDSSAKPPLRWNHLTEERTIAELEPPFVHFIHDVGPHAPYGVDNTVWDSTREFFAATNDPMTLCDRYQDDCVNSADRFEPIYDYLQSSGLLEETLVIYTSDHGQVLGESTYGGQFGHVDPMCPELVEIPVTFMGAGLPTDHEYPGLVSGTDVAPTALAAQGRPVPDECDGQQLWTATPGADRTVRCDAWAYKPITVRDTTIPITAYAAAGVWDRGGGHVFQRRSRLLRCAYLAHKLLRGTQAPVWRPNASFETLAGLARTYLRSEHSYGSPSVTADAAKAAVPEQFTRASDRSFDASDDALEEKLADLGYLS